MTMIPEKYKAVVLPDYNLNIIRGLLGLKIEEKTPGELQDDEVLVKVEAAPCNPSDLAFMQGGYNIVKTTPVVPGFEGAGTVVRTGNSEASRKLDGKKVSCFTQEDRDGTWAEYFITKANSCIPVRDDMPFDQAACFSINPFTAYGMFEKAQMNDSAAIIQNAAGSQVANYIRTLAELNNIKVIDIVRKEKQVAELEQRGAENVLFSGDEDFPGKLKELAHHLDATTAFDAVAGDMTGILFNAMPEYSEVLVYGGLSGKMIEGIDMLDVIFMNKTISGFNLNQWIRDIGEEKFEDVSGQLQDMFIREILRTDIQGSFKIDEVVKALRQYLGNMSAGKILLTSY